MFVVVIDFIVANVVVNDDANLCSRWNMGMSSFIIIILRTMKSCHNRRDYR